MSEQTDPLDLEAMARKVAERYLLPGEGSHKDELIGIILSALKRVRDAGEGRKVRYYRGILLKIAGGWETPSSLAQMAIDHEFHSTNCAYERDESADCDCERAAVAAALEKAAGHLEKLADEYGDKSLEHTKYNRVDAAETCSYFEDELLKIAPTIRQLAGEEK